MERIFVTGAGGFVGSHLLQALLAEDCEVLALFRRPPSVPPSCAVVEGDYSDPNGFSSELAAFEPDTVIHLAWDGVANDRHAALDQFDNMPASRRLLETCAAAGARHWIALGSQAEYGPHAGVISETTAALPTTVYGAAKLTTYLVTRSVAASLDMRFSWIRLFSCYGPGDLGNWLIPYLMKTYTAGDVPSLTPGEQAWDYLHVRDAAGAILAVARTSAADGVFNLGSGAPIRIAEVAERIRGRLAPESEIGLGRKPYQENQIMHMEADIARLTDATGWRPAVDFASGLTETMDWYLERTAK